MFRIMIIRMQDNYYELVDLGIVAVGSCGHEDGDCWGRNEGNGLGTVLMVAGTELFLRTKTLYQGLWAVLSGILLVVSMAAST